MSGNIFLHIACYYRAAFNDANVLKELHLWPKYAYWGPLHTRAKSRNHEIVRAQMKVSKGHPKTLPKLRSVVMDPQV